MVYFDSAYIAKFYLEEPDSGAIAALERQFDADCGQGLWIWIPVTAALIDQARAAYARASKKQFMRAADALHLASASAHGFREIYSNDRQVLAATRLFGLRDATVA